MRNLIEYFFDEREGVGHFTYENMYTGELDQVNKSQPMAKPEPNREKYFGELVLWLKTQDPYGI